MSGLRILNECTTMWSAHGAETWHDCMLLGEHEGDHECACGATLPPMTP